MKHERARWGVTVVMFGLASVAVLPLAWVACCAFKQPADIDRYLFLPWSGLHRLTFANFSALLAQGNFGRWLVNSVFLASATSVLSVAISSLAGFALAKYKFRGRSIVLASIIAMMLLPSQVMVGSLYNLMHRLGLINSYLAILAPGSVSLFGTILFRQAMLGAPDELLDAARIDGCGEWRLWWEVALPGVKPMIAAYALISFMASWNNFLWPQIVLQDEGKFTLPIGLNNLAGLPGFQHQVGILMAGALVSIVPVMMLFLVMQKEFLAGLTSGAVKG